MDMARQSGRARLQRQNQDKQSRRGFSAYNGLRFSFVIQPPTPSVSTLTEELQTSDSHTCPSRCPTHSLAPAISLLPDCKPSVAELPTLLEIVQAGIQGAL